MDDSRGNLLGQAVLQPEPKPKRGKEPGFFSMHWDFRPGQTFKRIVDVPFYRIKRAGIRNHNAGSAEP